MSKVAVMCVKIATSQEANQAAAGMISKVLTQNTYIVTTAADGPTLPADGHGFLVKAITGHVAARLKSAGGAATASPSNTTHQIVVMQGEAEYLPALVGEILSLVEVSS